MRAEALAFLEQAQDFLHSGNRADRGEPAPSLLRPHEPRKGAASTTGLHAWWRSSPSSSGWNVRSLISRVVSELGNDLARGASGNRLGRREVALVVAVGSEPRHGCDPAKLESRERLFALIVLRIFHSYCDESETGGSAFAIAGYVAPVATWNELEAAWTEALADEALSEFHACLCVNGKKEFRRRSKEERSRIEDRFIRLVAESGVQGFVSAIDLAAYDALSAEFMELRSEGYWKAYLLAFQHQVELMAAWLDAQGIEAAEKVAFFFDWNDEFNETALNLFNSVKRSDLGYASRLRNLTFVDSKDTPAIQTADLLAYEARKEFSERIYSPAPKPSRPAWLRLYQGNGDSQVQVQHFNQASLTDLVDVLRGMPKRHAR